MTSADWIAAAILTAFALLITLHQHQTKHRSTTETAEPQDGEPRT